MRTVQEYLKELDKDRLISIYMEEHKDYYIVDCTDKGRTIRDITDRLQNVLSGFIDRLRTIRITEPEDGKKCILLAHRSLNDDWHDMEFSLVHADEVLNDPDNAEAYGYEVCYQSEVMGYLVSDAPLTQRYIYHLIVDVLHETSFYGFNEEELEDVRSSLENLSFDEEHDAISYDEFLKSTLEDKDDYDRGIFLDKPSEDEKGLLNELHEVEHRYRDYCFRKELAILRADLQRNS
ncbi:MAG: hypothetical protein E7Z70_01905 [Thermoplasmata archaeon]|nr:hypothetical protein [Thermoplasmata archaeon]